MPLCTALYGVNRSLCKQSFWYISPRCIYRHYFLHLAFPLQTYGHFFVLSCTDLFCKWETAYFGWYYARFWLILWSWISDVNEETDSTDERSTSTTDLIFHLIDSRKLLHQRYNLNKIDSLKVWWAILLVISFNSSLPVSRMFLFSMFLFCLLFLLWAWRYA